MTDERKHSKVKTFTPQEDGSMQIETESYHEKLSGYKKEVMKHIKTSNATLLSDVISCLDVLKGKGTPELTIVITSDKHNIPSMITKTYTIEKETFNKR